MRSSPSLNFGLCLLNIALSGHKTQTTVYRIDYMTEGCLEVKLPAIWTDEKAEVGRVRAEKRRRKKIRKERVRKKKMQVREKVAKSQNIVFFQYFVTPEGRKVGSGVLSHLAR